MKPTNRFDAALQTALEKYPNLNKSKANMVMTSIEERLTYLKTFSQPGESEVESINFILSLEIKNLEEREQYRYMARAHFTGRQLCLVDN